LLVLFHCFENCDSEPFCFHIATTVAAPPVGATKDLGGEDVHTADSPSLLEPPIGVEAALACETSVLDVTLALGRSGTNNRDTVCGLLTECFQDVSFDILTMSYLFSRCRVFTFSCFCA
jgi:hypothetical protein